MKQCMRIISLVLALILVMGSFSGCDLLSSLQKEIEDTPAVPATIPAPAKPEPTEPKKMEPTELAAYVQERTVTLTVEDHNGGTSKGSGFFIDDEGTLVTSYHVIDAAESISVEVSDGGSYDVSKIVDFSEMYDLAVLQLDISGNPYLKLSEERAQTGEKVYAVGSSLGFLDGTFSDGIVSNASRTVGMIDCVQTTAAISSGNSGGPLVNEYGEVIGINAFSYTRGDGLHLAVKVSVLDILSMDKNWNINQFREWYKKEIDRSYKVWNYTDNEWELSKINTYQHVTGDACFASSMTWAFTDGDFEDVVEGYDEGYGIFWYEYDVNSFDAYTAYLNTVGFVFLESEDFNEGTSYYYVNEFTGHYIDIFVWADKEYVFIEPYSK